MAFKRLLVPLAHSGGRFGLYALWETGNMAGRAASPAHQPAILFFESWGENTEMWLTLPVAAGIMNFSSKSFPAG